MFKEGDKVLTLDEGIGVIQSNIYDGEFYYVSVNGLQAIYSADELQPLQNMNIGDLVEIGRHKIFGVIKEIKGDGYVKIHVGKYNILWLGYDVKPIELGKQISIMRNNTITSVIPTEVKDYKVKCLDVYEQETFEISPNAFYSPIDYRVDEYVSDVTGNLVKIIAVGPNGAIVEFMDEEIDYEEEENLLRFEKVELQGGLHRGKVGTLAPGFNAGKKTLGIKLDNGVTTFIEKSKVFPLIYEEYGYIPTRIGRIQPFKSYPVLKRDDGYHFVVGYTTHKVTNYNKQPIAKDIKTCISEYQNHQALLERTNMME